MKIDSTRSVIWLGLLVAVGIAFFLSPFASKAPDGLERVAEDKGFIGKEVTNTPYQAPAANYAMPGIKNEWLSTPLAGLLGTCLTFGSAYGLAQLLGKRKSRKVGR